LQEVLEMREAPIGISVIYGIPGSTGSGRPAIEDRYAREIEVVGKLSGSLACIGEGIVVAVDEHEGLAGGRAQPLGEKVAESTLIKVRETPQDDVLGGIFFGPSP